MANKPKKAKKYPHEGFKAKTVGYETYGMSNVRDLGSPQKSYYKVKRKFLGHVTGDIEGKHYKPVQGKIALGMGELTEAVKRKEISYKKYIRKTGGKDKTTKSTEKSVRAKSPNWRVRWAEKKAAKGFDVTKNRTIVYGDPHTGGVTHRKINPQVFGSYNKGGIIQHD